MSINLTNRSFIDPSGVPDLTLTIPAKVEVHIVDKQGTTHEIISVRNDNLDFDFAEDTKIYVE